MRKIDEIIVHCTATPRGREFTVKQIDACHRARGFQGIGYHYVVYLDGSVHKGRSVDRVGAHAKGHNARSIGVCYVGGVEADGRTCADTRTAAQKRALGQLIAELKRQYPSVRRVIGHRDTSPDLNGDGRITPEEYIKACPCFDAGAEYNHLAS